MSFNKKGIIGSVMINFVVIIAIIIILLLFIFGSSMVKKSDKVKGEISVMDEMNVGLNSVLGYMLFDSKNYYNNQVQIRFFIEKGMNLKEAVMEAEKDDTK